MSLTAEIIAVAEPKRRGGKRPGSGRPKTDRNDVVVRMAKDIVDHAKYVCDRRGLTLAEYFDGFRPQVMKDFRDESTRAAGLN